MVLTKQELCEKRQMLLFSVTSHITLPCYWIALSAAPDREIQ